MRLFYLVKAEVGAILHHDLDDLVRQEAALTCRAVGDDDIGLGHLLHHDEDAPADHRVVLSLEDVADLDGMLHAYATGDMHDERVDAEHRVEGDDAVAIVCYLII